MFRQKKKKKERKSQMRTVFTNFPKIAASRV